MMLGLGLGLGGRATGAVGAFTPASLGLNAWWRRYAGVIWEGTASAGDSGNRDLNTAGDSAPDVDSLNSQGVAHFVEANGDAIVGEAISNYVTASAGTMICLTRPTSAAATAGAHSDPAIWDGGASAKLTFSSSGAQFCAFDSGQKTVTIACSTGAYHALIMTWNGTNLTGQVDRGAPSSTACTDLFSLASTLTVSKNPGIAFFDQRLVELMFAPTVLSAGDIDNVLDYFEAEYGLTL